MFILRIHLWQWINRRTEWYIKHFASFFFLERDKDYAQQEPWYIQQDSNRVISIKTLFPWYLLDTWNLMNKTILTGKWYILQETGSLGTKLATGKEIKSEYVSFAKYTSRLCCVSEPILIFRRFKLHLPSLSRKIFDDPFLVASKNHKNCFYCSNCFYIKLRCINENVFIL